MLDKCNEIKNKYQEIKTKQNDFRALASDLRTNRAPLVVIKKEIKALLVWFENNLEMIIKVENMPSPFAEVYAYNDLPIPEKETQVIDLEKQLKEDCEAYRVCGLSAWADNIETFLPRLKKMISENKGGIAREMQEGAIAIFMPGRAVQYANAVETLTQKLKPVWKEQGEEKTVNDGYLTGDHLIAELEKIAKEKTVDIPEEPYLMLTKPTQRPELTSMTVDEQIVEIVERNKKRKKGNKPAEFAMMPTEYAVMQKFFTARAKNLKNNDGKGLFEKLDPLEIATFIRFVSIPLSPRGFVAYGYWNPSGCRLYFAHGGVDAASSGGVRFAVRLS